MRGISKSKHENLLKAFDQLDKLLTEKLMLEPEQDLNESTSDLKQAMLKAESAREELEQLYAEYNVNLKILASIIIQYESIYDYLRLDHIGKRLKELKREIQTNDERFDELKTGIHAAYNT